MTDETAPKWEKTIEFIFNQPQATIEVHCECGRMTTAVFDTKRGHEFLCPTHGLVMTAKTVN